MNKPSAYLAGTLVALALSSSPLQAAAKLIIFQVPGASATFAQAITNSGEVIGWFYAQAASHGFIRAKDGSLATIDVPGALYTELTAARDDGAIVGTYAVTTARRVERRGFIRTPDGQITAFQPPHGNLYTYPISISDAGWIAGTGQRGGHKDSFFGFLRDPSGHFTEFGDDLMVNCANSHNTTAGQLHAGSQWHGFVRAADGTIAQFDLDGATYTDVAAINSSGTAIGYSAFADNHDEGFIRATDGTLSTFVAAQDAKSTALSGINKKGAIVGEYESKDGSNHGFVRAPDGTITTIDVPGADSTSPNSINAKGQVAGTFVTEGVTLGFIWKP